MFVDFLLIVILHLSELSDPIFSPLYIANFWLTWGQYCGLLSSSVSCLSSLHLFSEIFGCQRTKWTTGYLRTSKAVWRNISQERQCTYWKPPLSSCLPLTITTLVEMVKIHPTILWICKQNHLGVNSNPWPQTSGNYLSLTQVSFYVRSMSSVSFKAICYNSCWIFLLFPIV